jgi:BirA family biotin operon repressor/biotin-[acetyl-CoA-carboxylase] ligase
MKTQILRYDRVSSTQEIARGLALAGAGAGTVVVAEVQERGRGRRGRTWLSPRGGLYASFILRPDQLLSLRAGVALARALRDLGICAALKWPNDVLVAERKIAGILIETTERWAIVGMGVNLERAPLPSSTCVKEEAKIPPTMDILLRSILANLEVLRSGEILEAYRELSATIGREVQIEMEAPGAPRVIRGRATGIDRNGRLLVEGDDGTCYVIVSGDCVHLRGAVI